MIVQRVLQLARKLNIKYKTLCLRRSIIGRYMPLGALVIETTTYCDLRCSACYRTLHDFSEKNKHMSLDDFKFYVDNTPPAFSLTLHGLGEPVLNPDLIKMIEYAKQKRKYASIMFTTNAVTKPPEFYEELFGSGLDKLVVSVDSLHPKEIEQLRPGTSIERLRANIRHLSARFPKRVSVCMVIGKINFGTVYETLSELADLGVQSILIQPVGDMGGVTFCLTAEEKHQLFNEMTELKKSKRFGFSFPYFDQVLKRPDVPCTEAYVSPCITVEGYVTPCCRILDKDIFNYGCLKDKSFNEIFFSKEAKLLRKSISQGNYPDFCKNCVPFSFD